MGSVAGFTTEPPRHTLVVAKLGMNALTGSVSNNLPSSTSIMSATDVIGFVIE
jgi:hypothetical protein